MNKILVAGVVKAACEYFSVSELDFYSRRRTRLISDCRAVSFWLARHLTPCSLQEIGRQCGWLDHSAVRAGINRVDSSPPLLAWAEKIKSDILSGK